MGFSSRDYQHLLATRGTDRLGRTAGPPNVQIGTPAAGREGGANAPAQPKGTVDLSGGMNGLERAYAAYLAMRQAAGEIVWFAYEPVRLRLAASTYFTPDFLVMLPGERWECHETKGFMREAARVRLRVAADLFPWRFVLVRQVDGRWEWETVPGAYRSGT